MYKKKSKAKFLHNQIIAFIEKNPKASSKYIADKFGASSQYVYQLRKRHNLDKALEMSKPLTKSSIKEEVMSLSVANRIKMLQMAKLHTEDNVNHPPHYTVGGIETIDFIEAKKLNYNLGNVIKYITRADHKGSRNEDLKKALWYLNREVSKLSK
jgi:hypothetical protein